MNTNSEYVAKIKYYRMELHDLRQQLWQAEHDDSLDTLLGMYRNDIRDHERSLYEVIVLYGTKLNGELCEI